MEREEERRLYVDEQQKIKRKIGLDSDFSLESENQDPGKSLGSTQSHAKPQQVELYKQKVSQLTQQNSNHFINYQIEKLHMEIKGELDRESFYIERLREKAEELQAGPSDNAKTTGFLSKPKKTTLCPQGKECKRIGKGCDNAHTAIELDFVPKAKMSGSMAAAADQIENKIKNDIIATDWRPWPSQGLESQPERDPPIPTNLTDNEVLHTLPFQHGP